MTPKRLSVEVSTIIDRPIDEVFAFVSNYENDPSWRAGVESMRHDPPGAVHVSMHTHEVLRLFGRTLRVEAEIIAMEPGKSVTFRSVAGPLQAQGVRKVSNSGTRTVFSYEVEANLAGLLSVLAPMVKRSFTKRARGDLARLKRILETSPPSEAR